MQKIHFEHLSVLKPRLLAGALSAGLLLSLLAGCSGTGSMYTPEMLEDTAEGAVGSAEEDSSGEDFPEGEGSRQGQDAEQGGSPAGPGAPAEEMHERRTWLEGTGSDLYTVQTVDSYYHFSLNGVSLKLPCTLQELADAGWELSASAAAENGEEVQIRPRSYEFFDAVPAGEGAASSGDRDGQGLIRLCLGNERSRAVSVSNSTVYGISVSADSGVDLKTAFDAGIGSQLSNLTSVYGTDSSVLTQTNYADGTVTVQYQFSNGLIEEERIPVLAEAEEKGMAEMMLVRTGPDGSTIADLSLFYFRLND